MRRPRLAARPRSVLAATVAMAVLAVGCGDGRSVSAPPSIPTTAGPRRGPAIATTVDAAVFTVDCRFSHRAPDDPIVHPGRAGASHLHDFFGATGTDASSTAASLRGGATTCEDRDDTAAYWVPTLLDGARPVQADYLRAYYRAAVGADTRTVQVPAPGLQLIAGNAHALPGHWMPTDQVGWGCGLRPRRLHHRPPSNCTVNAPLTLRLVFPDCWDGRHTASADHLSHLARSRDGRCPPSHPEAILQVQMSVQYPVWKPTSVSPSPRANELTLASGGWQTSHGDVLNAWVQRRLEHQTDLCIRVLANCTIG
ncbi:MAG: DUF1996 domain-containing protein [Acidimicrobiales bacterium]